MLFFIRTLEILQREMLFWRMPRVNYGRLATEQSNLRTRTIDRIPVKKILDLINNEDKTVPRAVAKIKPRLPKA